MPRFDTLYQIALERKSGEDALQQLIPDSLSPKALSEVPEDRILSAMTMCINQAGFSWKVIEKKWPEFEEAFFGFKVDTLLMLSDEQWENYTQDRRIVRNWQKIKTVKDNAQFIYLERCEREGISKLIANWPPSDQIGLLQYLKKHGSRLGGNTAQWFLRKIGKDCFVLTRDVIGALINAGLEIAPNPTSKRDLTRIQETFNDWHDQTGFSYTQLSKITAFSFGDNHVLT